MAGYFSKHDPENETKLYKKGSSSTASRPKPRPKTVAKGETDATRQSDFVKRQEANSAKLAAAAVKKPSSSGSAAASTGPKPRPTASTTTTTTPSKTTTTTSVKSKSSPARTKTLSLKTSSRPASRPSFQSEPSQKTKKTAFGRAIAANKGNNEKKALERMKKASRKG